MGIIIETSENQKKELYQTHYFKASYDELKNLYIETIKGLKHNLLSVNDDYKEIFSEAPHLTVTAKIIMQNPKETSIDFYIDSEFLFGSERHADAFIKTIYDAFSKKYELKGIALHK